MPSQPASAFYVDSTSSHTGVVHSYSDPSSAKADFHAFRTLVLSFSDFSPGETLVFGADADGSIGTTLNNFGAENTGAFTGQLNIRVLMSDGRIGNGTYLAVSGELIQAEVAFVPEPTVGLICLPALALALTRARRRPTQHDRC